MEFQVIDSVKPTMEEIKMSVDERARIGYSFPIKFAEQVSEEIWDIAYKWLESREDIPEEIKHIFNTSYNLLYLANLSKYGDLAKLNYVSLIEDLIEGTRILYQKKEYIGKEK